MAIVTLDQFCDKLHTNVVVAANHLVEEIKQGAADKTRVNTGHAKDGWKVQTITTSGQTAVVYNDVPYIQYLEHGTVHNEADAMLARTVAGINPNLNRFV